MWARVSGDTPRACWRGTARALQQSSCSRILASLRHSSARTERCLLRRTGLGLPTLRRYVHNMSELGLLADIGNRRFVLSKNFVIPNLEICSFEFKLANWRRALYQATRYRAFSHRVFVVLPSTSLSPALRHLEVFRKLNVGLISHDPVGNSLAIVRSRKREPVSRYRLIMAWGMLLARRG